MSSLFDKLKRNCKGPSSYVYSSFQYLNESARKEYYSIRRLLDEWFLKFKKQQGESVAEDLRERFRSKNNEIHHSALTELYIYNLLSESGYDIEIHPNLGHTSSRPDFLASKNGMPLFYLEARVISGKKDKKRKSLFENQILDAVNDISSPSFLICVDLRKTSAKKQPSVKRVKKLLQEQVDNLNLEQARKNKELNDILPTCTYQDEDWEIKFEFLPLTDEAIKERDSSSRVIGSISYGVRAINVDDEIKKTARDKLNKYGKLKLPLILAINVVSDEIFLDDYSVMSAMFGKMTVVFTSFSDGTTKSSSGRTLNGVLVHPKKGRIYTRLSGLLILKGLAMHNLKTCEIKLWHNPHASLPLDTNLLKLPQMTYNKKSGKMECV